MKLSHKKFMPASAHSVCTEKNFMLILLNLAFKKKSCGAQMYANKQLKMSEASGKDVVGVVFFKMLYFNL